MNLPIGSGAPAERGRPRRAPIPLALVLGLLAAGCASQRPVDFVWVSDYHPASAPPRGYVIGAGDLLLVKVFKQEEMSGKSLVRDDGKISLPFVNDVEAAGLTPRRLAETLQELLKPFVVNPVVTVSVETSRPTAVSVVGEVKKPGTYQVEPRGGVLQALAAASGLTDFADGDRIFVVRPEGRIRFTFRALAGADPAAVTFRIRDGDVVVVE